MNPLPPNADELVSAYLDGEAAPDEIALVESTPELLEQAESMRALLAPLNEPVAPSPAKEAHLSAALDLFDDLFAAGDTAAAPEERPHLAAVPGIAPSDVASPDADTPASLATGSNDNVASLEAARERRRRRVSPTVIAAAIAAVALLLFAVFSSGTGNDDVATGASEAVEATASEAASDAVDDAADAMDEEEAMDDEESRGRGGLSEAEAPQAAAPAEEAMDDDEEAMDEEEAMEDEEAMDDDEEAMEDENAGAVMADSDDFEMLLDSRNLWLFGEVSDAPTLERQLDIIPFDALRLRAELDFEGLFPRCRSELDVLPDDGASLIGEGTVDQMPVEVHLVDTEQERRIYVIAADACRVVFDFALGG